MGKKPYEKRLIWGASPPLSDRSSVSPASELGTFGHQSIAGGPWIRCRNQRKPHLGWCFQTLVNHGIFRYLCNKLYIFIISTGAGFLNHQPFSAWVFLLKWFGNSKQNCRLRDTPLDLKRSCIHSLKLTLHLKISGWKMNFLLGWPMFSGKLLISGRVRPKVHIQQLKAGVLEAKFIQRRHSQWITTNPWHPDMFHKLPLNFGMASQRVPWKDSSERMCR